MSSACASDRFLQSDTKTKFYYQGNDVRIKKPVCWVLGVLVVLALVLTGLATYYITTSHQADQTVVKEDIKTIEEKPQPSRLVRLPDNVFPSYYRLKFVPSLDNGTFWGEVKITLRTTSINVNEIKLNAHSLVIRDGGVTLAEQNIQNLNEIRVKRQVSPGEDDATLNYFENNDNQEMPEEDNTYSSDHSYATVVTPKHISMAKISAVSVASVITNNQTEQLIISLNSVLKPDTDYVLQISFNGTAGRKNKPRGLTGFYIDSYSNTIDPNGKPHLYGLTAFEPTMARKAFPCFDEPKFKATFEISVGHPAHMTALSNMPNSSSEQMLDNPGWYWTHFDKSVKMSTYTVAFYVGEFDQRSTTYLSSDNETKLIRIWTQPSLLNQTGSALEVVPKLLKYFEDLFGIPYQLKKLDLVAAPSLINYGMENWGLVTLREIALLVEEDGDIESVLETIAHELAHMWFGNLVTMSWWNELWLKEGFATYMQRIGSAYITNTSAQDEFMFTIKMNLEIDALALAGSQSEQTHDMVDIFDKYSALEYDRAACIIRMLNHTVSGPVFVEGIRRYLKKWEYSNTVEDDLWTTMSEAVADSDDVSISRDVSMVQFMRSWTNQAGYPVVHVSINQTGEVTLTQMPFKADNSSASSDNIWSIPITYATLESEAASLVTTPQVWLVEQQKKLPLVVTRSLYLNVHRVGYYRVNYDPESWKRMGQIMSNKSDMIGKDAKLTLMDDAFHLAAASHISYELLLDFTTSFIRTEKSLTVWNFFMMEINLLQPMLQRTQYYSDFQKFMLHLMQPSLEYYNYGAHIPAGDNSLLVEGFVQEECELGSKRCVDWAKDLFQKSYERKDWSEIEKMSFVMRPTVLCTVIQYGGREEFEQMWSYYLASHDQAAQSDAAAALACTSEQHLILFLLELSLSDARVKSLDHASILWQTRRRSSHANYALIDGLLARWPRIVDKFGGSSDLLRDIVNCAIKAVGNQAEFDKMKQFFADNSKRLEMYRQEFTENMEKAWLRVQWLQQKAEAVGRWIRQYNLENGITTSF